MASPFPPIPTPDNTLAGIQATVIALKRAVDILTLGVGPASTRSTLTNAAAGATRISSVAAQTLASARDSTTVALTAAQMALQDALATTNANVTAAGNTAASALATAGDTTVAVSNEATTRQQADLAETEARTVADAALQNNINITNAAITTEANTRATADTAETNARTAADSALQTSINTVSANLTTEQTTRANADTAETNARTAADSTLQNNIDTANAAITTEANTRVAADTAQALATTTLSSTLSAQLNPKKTWKAATAPTFDQIFPPGVQACPVGNLDDGVSPVPYGVGWWTNTTRVENVGTDLAGWTLAGGHTIAATLVGAWAASSAYECFDLNGYGQIYWADPGTTYEFSAYTGAPRCRLLIGIYFYDASWTELGEFWSDAYGNGVNNMDAVGGASLSGYKRLWTIATAPANTTYVQFITRADNQGSAATGQSDPYQFITRPYFGRVPAGQTTPTDWQPWEPPVWINTAANNQVNIWSGIYGAGWVYSADTRIDANSASITSLMSTTNGLSAQWSMQATIDGVTGGLIFSGLKRADGTGVTYNLELNSNVVINGSLLVNGSITSTQIAPATIANSNMAPGSVDTPQLVANSVSHNGVVGGSGTQSVTVTCRAGARVLVIGGYAGDGPQVLNAANTSLNIYAGSTLLGSTVVTHRIDSTTVGYVTTTYGEYNPAMWFVLYLPTVTGNVTFSVSSPVASGSFALSVTELAA